MKANEAPEKIYCGNNGHGNLSYSNLPFPNAVEYTRTDAFIEKACGWIKENITNNPNANSVLVRNSCVTLGMLIEDFKNYMKEE